jgi:hypothetical protein
MGKYSRAYIQKCEKIIILRFVITCGVLLSQLKLREENDGKHQGTHIAGFQERVLPVDKVAYSLYTFH